MSDLSSQTSSPLVIAGREMRSRLLLGTGGFPSLELLAEAIAVSGCELVTVALRRVDPSARGSLMDVVADAGVELLPNTAGCMTARDAVITARLAREAFATDWIKLEVIGDEDTLLPDAPELLRAAEELVDEGFAGAPAGGHRLRGGDAAGLADRQRHGDSQPVQHRADPRGGGRAGGPGRGHRHGV